MTQNCKSLFSYNAFHQLISLLTVDIRFLDGSLEVKRQGELFTVPNRLEVLSSCSAQESSSLQLATPLVNNKDDNNNVEELVNHLSDEIDKAVKRLLESEGFAFYCEFPKSSVKEVSQAKKKKKKIDKGSGEDILYTCNIAFQIAAALSHKQSNKMDEGEEIGLSRHSNEQKGDPFKL